MRRVIQPLASLALIVGLAAPVHAAAGDSEPRERHCSVTVVGQKPSGEFVTTPMTCRSTGSSGMSVASSAIAFHYTGANYSGSTLTVNGSACSGGWMDMPAGWDNVISSTWSFCTVDHYDNDGLGGTVETVAGSGNLTYMDNRTNAALYR